MTVYIQIPIYILLSNITCTYVYTYIYLYVYIYMCIYIYVYIYIHIYVYIWIFMCIYIYTYIYLYVYIYIYKNKWRHMCLNKWIYTHINIGKTIFKFKKEIKVEEGAIAPPPMIITIPPNSGLIIGIFYYLYVVSLTFAFGWSTFLWRMRFCDTVIVIFLK
jgi:hypothetical protein